MWRYNIDDGKENKLMCEKAQKRDTKNSDRDGGKKLRSARRKKTQKISIDFPFSTTLETQFKYQVSFPASI